MSKESQPLRVERYNQIAFLADTLAELWSGTPHSPVRDVEHTYQRALKRAKQGFEAAEAAYTQFEACPKTRKNKASLQAYEAQCKAHAAAGTRALGTVFRCLDI